MADEPTVEIMVALVYTPAGQPAARVERVLLGGGTKTVTVDGVPEERVHPLAVGYHVTLLSPDRMIPDQMLDADDYDAAVAYGVAYAEKLADHAERIASLAEDLKVD